MFSLRSSIPQAAGTACLVFLLALAASAQTNRISGQVLGVERRPLVDVWVELLNEVNSVLLRQKTTGSGTFQFVGMTGGKYTVLVRPFGTDYEEQSQEVEIVNIVSGGRRTSDAQNVTFYLRTRKAAEKKPGAVGVVFAQEVPPDAKKAYDKGIAEIESNRIESGIAELENAINIFPDYFYALDRLGSELLKRQMYTDAKKHFEKASSVNPKSSNSWYGLSYSLYALGKIDESIEAAKKAVNISPESVDINLMLGVALRRGRSYFEAEKSLLKAKKLSNGLSADASWNLALLYVYNLRNNRLAAEELENYLKVKPDHPQAERLRRLAQNLRMSA